MLTLIAAFLILFGAAGTGLFMNVKKASHTETRNPASDRQRAALLIKKLNDIKQMKRQANVEDLDLMAKIDYSITDLQDMMDLSNDYVQFGLDERAMLLRMRIIAERKKRNEPQQFEVQKVVIYHYNRHEWKEARKLLDDELDYELGRKDAAHTAKAELDLMCFGFLTKDAKLIDQMHHQLNKVKGSDDVQTSLQFFMTPGKDSLFDEVTQKDPHFAEDLISSAPPTVPKQKSPDHSELLGFDSTKRL